MDNTSLSILLFGVRILIVWIVVVTAKDKNRDSWGWGIFAFILPLIALISVFAAKHKTLKRNKP